MPQELPLQATLGAALKIVPVVEPTLRRLQHLI